MKEIHVSVADRVLTVPPYQTVGSILEKAGFVLLSRYEDNPIVGAIVNGELHPLGYAIETEIASVEPVRAFDYYGRRIYRHSLTFLLGMAAYQLYPDKALTIWHAMGNSLYFGFEDNSPVTEDQVQGISSRMTSIVRNNYEIEFTALPCSEAVKHFERQQAKSTVDLVENFNQPVIQLYRIENYHDMAYEPLAPNTGILTVWELVPYGGRGMLLRYPDSANVKSVGSMRDNPKLFGVFEEYKQWGRILGVSCLGQMNRKVTGGDIGEYIRLSESLQRRKLYALADEIIKRKSKSVFISGPSSSGKTTFARKLCEQLRLMGYNPLQLSLDDYYKPRVGIPRDENGEIDYECIEALRIDLFRKDMEDLFSGKEIHIPHWDFAKQLRTYSSRPVRLDALTIFVIEGIHGLNPMFTSCVPQDSLYKVYISALTQLTLDNHNRISTTDTRILRRIIRDNRTRAIDATTTLGMWKNVTKGERLHIFPFQTNADMFFNTSLDYEIGILSTYAIPLLSEVTPENRAAYTDARRLLCFLKFINPIPPNQVPSDSLLREFIGDGDYE